MFEYSWDYHESWSSDEYYFEIHPYLRGSTCVYIMDVPKYIKYQDLYSCIRSLRITAELTGNKSWQRAGYRTWEVTCQTAKDAEKLFLLAQGRSVAIPNRPIYHLLLGSSPIGPIDDTEVNPDDISIPPPFFVKLNPRSANPQNLSLSTFYDMFRELGPICCLNPDVNMGHDYNTVVVRFWYQNSSTRASEWSNSFESRALEWLLQEYNPRQLICTVSTDRNVFWLIIPTNPIAAQNLGKLLTKDMLEVLFQIGQEVPSVEIIQGKRRKSFITFKTATEAEQALKRMNGTIIHGEKMSVQYNEFRAAWSPKAPHNDGAEFTREPQRSKAEKHSYEDIQSTEDYPSLNKGSERSLSEDIFAELQAAYEKVAEAEEDVENWKAAEELAGTRVMEAQDANLLAEAMLTEALRKKEEAAAALISAQKAQREAQTATMAACDALEEARLNKLAKERVWAQYEETPPRSSEYSSSNLNQDGPDQANSREQDDTTRLRESMEKMRQLLREEEVERSRRKMAELYSRESEDATKRKAKESQSAGPPGNTERDAKYGAQEEAWRFQKDRERREFARAEAMRKAKQDEERRVQEEVDRREKEWREATRREEDRCRRRDEGRWPRPGFFSSGGGWSSTDALTRFNAICVEFDTITFSEQQPLAFRSIPWPVLHSPYDLKVEHVEWSSVEDFFNAMRLLLTQERYRVTVQKSHRRFHPDRWRQKLSTVQDSQLKDTLERAIIMVSQAITPIWQSSRKTVW